MIFINVRHKVADFTKWRHYFDADLARRKDSGATGIEYVYRDLEDTNTVTIIMQWENLEKARMFVQDPKLVEIMKNAGVMSEPEVRFLRYD
jgi:hypothetical protein